MLMHCEPLKPSFTTTASHDSYYAIQSNTLPTHFSTGATPAIPPWPLASSQFSAGSPTSYSRCASLTPAPAPRSWLRGRRGSRQEGRRAHKSGAAEVSKCMAFACKLDMAPTTAVFITTVVSAACIHVWRLCRLLSSISTSLSNGTFQPGVLLLSMCVDCARCAWSIKANPPEL